MLGAGAVGLSTRGCAVSPVIAGVPDLAGLKAIDPATGSVRLDDPLRGGLFRWQAGDRRADVAGDVFEGRYVASHARPAREGAWVRQGDILTPEMFGARPGQSDHDAHLDALFAHVEGGMQLELNGRYTVSRGFTIVRKSRFRIGGTGTIVMRVGVPVDYGYWMLYLVELSSLTFDANRAARSPREVPAHSISFQSCSRFRCVDVHAVNAVCDGFYLASATPGRPETHCRDFQFLNCAADNCFRQGCSIIQGHGGLFRGGAFTNTNGTAPAAGIDLEADPGDPEGAISDIAIENVRFAGNRGFGLLVSTVARARDVTVVDCVFEDNAAGAISWGATRGRIAGARISGFGAAATRGAIDVPAGDGWRGDAATTIEAPHFSRVSTTRPANPLIYVHSEAYGAVAITGMKADACGAIAGLHRDTSSLTGSTVGASLGRVDGAIGVSGRDCIVARNSIARFFGSVVVATGEGIVVRENVLTAPRFNDANGAIRILAGGAVVEANIIEGSGAATAIRMMQAPRALRGNRISGFARSIALQPQ
jgi:hypothetical protein